MIAPGASIGERYVLLSRIAAGGMGEVWRARDQRLERDVALKVLHAEHADDESFRARLRSEAQAAAGVSSDRVVSVYDWGEQPDDVGGCLSYIVMELVPGDTLAGVLAREGMLSAERTSAVVTDTATGLAAAHARGLVHRDVKPANLLVADDGHIKVADFGIARAADGIGLTATGTLVGTAMYLSPEQVRGEPATSASDVYSLGIVAYQCLTGDVPFRAEGDIATATARLHAAVPPLPDSVEPQLRDMVLSMLDLDPARRPAAAQISMPRSAPPAATRILPAPMPLPETTALAADLPAAIATTPARATRLPVLSVAAGVLVLACVLAATFGFGGLPGAAGRGSTHPTGTSTAHPNQRASAAAKKHPVSKPSHHPVEPVAKKTPVAPPAAGKPKPGPDAGHGRAHAPGQLKKLGPAGKPKGGKPKAPKAH